MNIMKQEALICSAIGFDHCIYLVAIKTCTTKHDLQTTLFAVRVSQYRFEPLRTVQWNFISSFGAVVCFVTIWRISETALNVTELQVM